MAFNVQNSHAKSLGEFNQLAANRPATQHAQCLGVQATHGQCVQAKKARCAPTAIMHQRFPLGYTAGQLQNTRHGVLSHGFGAVIHHIAYLDAALRTSRFVHVVGTRGHQLNHFQFGRRIQFSRANFHLVDNQNFRFLDALFQRVCGGERVFSPRVRALWARQRGTYGFAFQPNNVHGLVSPVQLLEGYRLIAGFDTGANHENI